MNRYLQECFRRPSHEQTLIRDSLGNWIWTRESGPATGGKVELFWASGEANSFQEFKKIGVLLGENSIFKASGGQFSLTSLEGNTSIYASFIGDGDLFFSSTNNIYESSCWTPKEKIDLPKAREVLAGNILVYKESVIVGWSVQMDGPESIVGISILNGTVWQNYYIHKGRGAFAPVIVSDKETLHVAWSQANEKTYYTSFNLGHIEKKNFVFFEPVMISNQGRQPTMVTYENDVILAFETYLSLPDSYCIKENGAVLKRFQLTDFEPRLQISLCHSFNLTKDTNGVPVLFFAENYRDLIFSSRWLGTAWSPLKTEPSILCNTPRSDHLYSQPSRLIVEKNHPENSDKIGVIVEAENSFSPPIFHKYEPISLAIKENCSVHFYDLAEISKTENLELDLRSGLKSSCNPLMHKGSKDSLNSIQAVNRAVVSRVQNSWKIWFSCLSIEKKDVGFEWWKALNIGHISSDDGILWDQNQAISIENLSCQPYVYYDETEQDMSCKYKSVYFLISREKEIAGHNDEYDCLEDLIPGFLYTSPDGVKWKKQSAYLRSPGGMWLEHCPMCLFRDESDPNPDYLWKSYGYASLTSCRRVCSLATSPDLINWTLHPEPALCPEQQMLPVVESGHWSQLHGMEVFKLDNYYVAMVQRQIDKDISDITLAFSRDGLRFDPVLTEQCIIPLGNSGDWDNGMIMPAGINCLKDKIRVYYTSTKINKHREILGSSLGFTEFTGKYFSKLKVKDELNAAHIVTVPVKVKSWQKIKVIVHGKDIDTEVSAKTVDSGEIFVCSDGIIEFANENQVEFQILVNAKGNDSAVYGLDFINLIQY